MPIKMETISSTELTDIKSEIKVEDYCEPSVTANTLTMPPQQQPQPQQQQQQHHQQELEHQMHHQQNNCWVGLLLN